ncbi:hypothetical protein HYH02_000008 [Chlamydomonas schloesseri]|uniref:Uncharacterized protein n=1 Tax=Chlamydomonas schloesseri TaxID=2026947 RepID=A0A836B7E6_9CHLO|nr:hypothetical protein HYH02_000008 [Chlamydomonas schloesseri]|eukprot:KAG2449902.1 hypothetical protein HYH02_000008 [Chlamydomonas schloesseri]
MLASDALPLSQQPQPTQQQSQQTSQQQQAQLQSGLLLDGEGGAPNSGAGTHVAEAVDGAQLLLQQMLLASGDVDGASGSAGQGGDLGGIGLDLSSQQQQQQQPSVMQHLASLPTQALVQQSTDPLQLSGIINFTFSQSPNPSFVLNTQLDSSGSTPVATLTQALRVVLAARKINTQAVARFDLGFVPFLVSDAAEGIGLLVYKCSLHQEGARGSVLKIDSSSNPLVAGISLFNMLQSGGQMLEVIFTAEASKVALQALSIMRINLANNGRDVLLLLSTVDYTADASGPKNYFLLKLTPITPPLPCFQHQIEANKAASAAAAAAASSSYMSAPEPAGMQGMGMGMGGLARPMQMHGGPGLGPPVLSPALGPVPGAGGLGMKAGGLGMGVGSMQGYLPMAGAGGMGMGMAAAAAGASSAKQQRARKADYVIVTEDTAIKNAAGAIAKVLGRVSNQGQCCPVYTEKKTESFTTVISVAVKAIAVARGYVCNEGMGNEVGFQPYLRHLDRRLDLLDLHNFLAPEKQHQHQLQQQHQQMLSAAAGLGYGQPHLGMPGLGAAGLLGAAGAAGKGPMGLVGAGMQPQMGLGMGGYGGAAGMLGGGGMMPAKYTSPMDSFELLDEDALSDERCELAFDVFKVPQLHELQDAGNLPVKVTAHSRPNVVSNIISKLVTERSGAVLITAGGKAMHVAMTAVVSARARLKAKGVDIILLPKFVTVDTTSTLGWESVFLRFTIVRWAPLPPAGAAGMGGMGAMHADAMMAAAVAGGRYLLPQLG